MCYNSITKTASVVVKTRRSKLEKSITFKFGATFGTYFPDHNMVKFGGMGFQIEAANPKMKAVIEAAVAYFN